jgi:hypothetical protein
MITAENVKELAIRFWAIVGSSSDGHEAAGMFLTGGLLLPDGAWVSIAEHQAMHRPLCDESHEWLSLSVTTLCEDPQRVLARGRPAYLQVMRQLVRQPRRPKPPRADMIPPRA